MSFQDYKTTYTDCSSGAKVFSYNKLEGNEKLPVLVLLHGYPQNSLMWKKFVDEIPPQWRVIVLDLPGYGNSTKPIPPNSDSASHSKREWGKDVVHVVSSLCGDGTKFIAYGHDRGARVAYRLALDFPERIAGAAVLDIVPGAYVWDAMRLENGHLETKRSHHWIFLSSPRPLPETMIGSNPEYYFRFTIASWSGGKKDIEWVEDSIAPYLDSEKGKDTIAAVCEDYRAGATHDITDDYASTINPLTRSSTEISSPPAFSCPLLVLSSAYLRRRFDVDRVWTSLSKPGMVTSHQIGDDSTGHFFVNEKQAETGERTREWLAQFE